MPVLSRGASSAAVVSSLHSAKSKGGSQPLDGRVSGRPGSQGSLKVKRRKSHWRDSTAESVHNNVMKCRGFPLTQKLLTGKPEEATLDEVHQLFTCMHAIDSFLEVEVLLMYLRDTFRCKSHDLQHIRLTLEDVAEDGCVSSVHFCGIAAGSGREALLELHRLKEQGTQVDVRRDLLLNKLSWRVDRDEAFATLPLTVFYMMIFLCLVIFHLKIYQRQQVERGIQNWIHGYGKGVDGPYLTKYASDVASFLEWLEQSGFPAILGDVRNGTTGICARLAISNTLVGDVKLEQRHFDGAVRSSWLLSSAAGVGYLAANPGALTSAAVSAARSFHSAGWANRHSSEMTLTFATFEESSKSFLLTKVVLLVGIYGHVHAAVSSAAVPSEPYPGWVSYPLDALFLLLLLHIMRKELWEIWLGGMSGFRDYWSLWNIIDWASISLGIISVGLWVGVCVAMSAEELHKFLQDDGAGSRTLRPDIMRIGEGDLNAIVSALELAHTRFFILHIVVAANTLSIIARFFKAFQANMRLNIVAKTFASCYQDIVHFMIVFLVIFFCLAVIAHTLFGTDVREFHTLGSSLNCCFMVLMGDFGWYVELGDSPNFLPSGIPRLLVVIWFWAYMFLVSIVLLNMLLAIILEKYSEVGASALGPNERTLWAQAYRYVNRWKSSRGDIPLTTVLAQLEDKNDPAHPDAAVSVESLKEHFQGMTDRQAHWLMSWLQQEAFLEETADRGGMDIERLKRTERLLTRLVDRVEHLVQHSGSSDERLSHVEEALGLPHQPQAARPQTPADSSEGAITPVPLNLPDNNTAADVAQEISPTSDPETQWRVPEEQMKTHTRAELPQSVWKQKQDGMMLDPPVKLTEAFDTIERRASDGEEREV